ncbi:MAG TPA: class I SAM-dependent methyltransferase [Thermomicrobiaceae bacterium]|nr:class I SAM-dependent methyltransferase [Thermomicrobiaceae bacterium]
MDEARRAEVGRHFEERYADASERDDTASVPWARLAPNPLLLDWLKRHDIHGDGRPALVIGCGLGDDAEALAQAGFRVTAIDVAPTAVAWCRRRFPASGVDYQTVDLFAAPAGFKQSFELVFDAYTLQALPEELRPEAMRAIAGFVAPGGTLLVIQRASRPGEPPPEHGPRGLTQAELEAFSGAGLRRLALEDLSAPGTSPWPQFRAEYRRD